MARKNKAEKKVVEETTNKSAVEDDSATELYKKIYLSEEERNMVNESKSSKSTVQTAQRPIGRSKLQFLSLYFFVPALVLSTVHTAINYYWRIMYFKMFREVLVETYGYTISFGDASTLERFLVLDWWSSFLFIIAVMYMARGSLLKGFFAGAIFSSVLGFNWVGTTFLRLKIVPFQHVDTIIADFVFQMSVGAVIGQLAVFVGAFFMPRAPVSNQKKND